MDVDYLIIGATGMLGSRLVEMLSAQFSVVGTHHRRISQNTIYCDLSEDASVRDTLSRFHPRVLIHVGGMTRPDECELHPNEAFAVNVEGMKRILKHFTGETILFFSTDYIFDGINAPFTEESKPNPLNIYGKTKLAAENLVLKSGRKSLIVRVAGLYGWSSSNTEFLERLRGPAPLICSKDHFSSQTWLDDVCRYVPVLRDVTGIVHLVGPGRYSRSSFIQLACKVLSPHIQVKAVPGSEVYHGATRPRDSSLRSKRLHFPMTPVGFALELLRKRLIITSAKAKELCDVPDEKQAKCE